MFLSLVPHFALFVLFVGASLLALPRRLCAHYERAGTNRTARQLLYINATTNARTHASTLGREGGYDLWRACAAPFNKPITTTQVGLHVANSDLFSFQVESSEVVDHFRPRRV